MKLTLLLELLVILIIVAYGAAHPVSVSRGMKGGARQEVAAVPVVAAPAPVKPAASSDDDDDVDLLALIGDDDGKLSIVSQAVVGTFYVLQMMLKTMMVMMTIWIFWGLWLVNFDVLICEHEDS